MRCPACGRENSPGTRFCGSCGTPLAAAPAAAPNYVPAARAVGPASKQGIGASIAGFIHVVNRDPTGALPMAVIFVLGAVISFLGWGPLSIPARLINGFVPQGNCISVRPGSIEMYFCSAKVAALTVVGPILLMVLLFLARNLIAGGLRSLMPRLPRDSHFLLGPLVATILFTMVWGAMHDTSYGATGIVPQKVFPALIGVFTYGTAKYGPLLQRLLGPLFDLRDRFPKWIRFLGALAAPLVLALILTAQERVSQEAMKEQVVVLVSLATTYLVLAPRSGTLMDGARQAFARRGR